MSIIDFVTNYLRCPFARLVESGVAIRLSKAKLPAPQPATITIVELRGSSTVSFAVTKFSRMPSYTCL